MPFLPMVPLAVVKHIPCLDHRRIPVSSFSLPWNCFVSLKTGKFTKFFFRSQILQFYQISRSQDEQLALSISYFEIYNENVYDLLSPMVGKHLAVREDPKRGVVVANLSVHEPKDAQHLLEMLEFGNRNRTQHPTDANAESSR